MNKWIFHGAGLTTQNRIQNRCCLRFSAIYEAEMIRIYTTMSSTGFQASSGDL
jgi:hypothetical protein